MSDSEDEQLHILTEISRSTASALRESLRYSLDPSSSSQIATTSQATASRKNKFITLSDEDDDSDSPVKKRPKTTVSRACPICLIQKSQSSVQKTKSTSKTSKVAEKTKKQEEKARKQKEKALEKARTKLLAEANKLVSDKKTTLADFQIQLSSAISQHPRFSHYMSDVDGKLIPHECKVTPVQRSSLPHSNVIQWQRRVWREYKEEERQWDLVDECVRQEPVVAMVFHVTELYQHLKSATQQVEAVKKAYPSHYRLFIFIDEVDRFMSSRSRAERDEFTGWDVRMNVMYKAHIVHTDGRESFATALYDFTADLGIKPHKCVNLT